MDDGGPPTTHLVDAAQAGDRCALEGLFVRYLPRVRQIVALRLGYTLGDFATFEDVVQEALLNVFQKLDRYESQPEARFRHWLATCVANSVNAYFRSPNRSKRSRTLPFFPHGGAGLMEAELAGDWRSPGELAEGAELAERIEAALLSMKKSHREVIILSRLCGMSPAGIASLMGFPSPSAARKALSRALRRLEKLLRA